MIDAFWMEILIILCVAFLVLGPKDVILFMYTLGQWIEKARIFLNDLKMSIDYETFKIREEEDRKRDDKDKRSSLHDD